MKIRLLVFRDDSRIDAVATSVQAKTYRHLQSIFAESRRVNVGHVMEELGIKRPQTFYSRLDHLQQKGLIEWSTLNPISV